MVYQGILTLSQTTNRLFQILEFADDNFKFDKNDIKFFKWTENIVGKGQIVDNKQVLLFSKCFQRTCTVDTKNKCLFGKGL